LKKIAKQVVKEANSLSKFPKMGVLENLLKDRSQNFRYILSSNYKIIYWINKEKNRIEVIDVFDTRQNTEGIYRNR
jgi:mRNA-degrading endonuclease RelE of RelBE toxin-antitoxin system